MRSQPGKPVFGGEPTLQLGAAVWKISPRADWVAVTCTGNCMNSFLLEENHFWALMSWECLTLYKLATIHTQHSQNCAATNPPPNTYFNFKGWGGRTSHRGLALPRWISEQRSFISGLLWSILLWQNVKISWNQDHCLLTHEIKSRSTMWTFKEVLESLITWEKIIWDFVYALITTLKLWSQ